MVHEKGFRGVLATQGLIFRKSNPVISPRLILMFVRFAALTSSPVAGPML